MSPLEHSLNYFLLFNYCIEKLYFDAVGDYRMKMFEADNTDEDGFKWQQHSKARDFGAEQKKDWR